MSDERPTEETVTDERPTEESATKRTVTEEIPADESRTEENAADGSPTDQREPSDASDQQDESAKPDATDERDGSARDPRVKASLLWGVVGLLAFLVLVQGYELWTDFRYSLAVKAGAALLVGVGATGLSYVAEPRLFG